VDLRRWNLVLHRHEDGSFTVRVWVDGKLLRPDCVGCSAAAALAYAAHALVDARPDDQLALRTQGDGHIEVCGVRDAIGATRWLAEQTEAMQEAARCEGAKSGTRPIVRAESVSGSSARQRAAKAL
jgi:hypothetical protein